MKTIRIITLLFLSLTLSFCSSDDDSNNGNTNADLIGTWRLTKEIDKYPGEPDDVYIVPDGCNEIVLEISDNTIETIEDYNCDGEVDGTYSTSYSRSGNTLSSNGYSVEITTLNDTTLIIQDIEDGDTYISEYERL